MARNLVSPILCDTAADAASLFDGAKMFSGTVLQIKSISTVSPTSGRYRWVAGSTSPDNNNSQLVIVPGTGSGSGKWVRCDNSFDLVLPFTFATADLAVLLTVPTELTIHVSLDGNENQWEVTTAFSGGAGSRIGLSIASAKIAGAAGSVMGGAAGDGIGAAVTLNNTGFWKSTSGIADAGYAHVLRGATADQIQFNRITSAFTAGVGNAHLACRLLGDNITAPPP